VNFDFTIKFYTFFNIGKNFKKIIEVKCPGVRAESRVFGTARAAEKPGCQRGLPEFFYQSPNSIIILNSVTSASK
jgi:hypothetical protein